MPGLRYFVNAAMLLVPVLGIVGCDAGDQQSSRPSSANSVIDAASAEPRGESMGSSDVDSTARTSAEHHYFHKQEQPHAAKWGYSAGIGPNEWGDLSPEYVLAKDGKQQSPIDIVNLAKQQLPEIEFLYRPVKIDLVYNGHTIQETEGAGSSIEVAGRRYELKQFHFHAPSEHTVDGVHADMEMHLVHKGDDGTVAVVAVLIVKGAANKAFDVIWDYLPTALNKRLQYGATVDAMTLLPDDHAYFQYQGSFTTPPCTQGVIWFVLTTPNEFSLEQIQKFRSIIDGNNRPTQPLYGREVVRSTE